MGFWDSTKKKVETGNTERQSQVGALHRAEKADERAILRERAEVAKRYAIEKAVGAHAAKEAIVGSGKKFGGWLLTGTKTGAYITKQKYKRGKYDAMISKGERDVLKRRLHRAGGRKKKYTYYPTQNTQGQYRVIRRRRRRRSNTGNMYNDYQPYGTRQDDWMPKINPNAFKW